MLIEFWFNTPKLSASLPSKLYFLLSRLVVNCLVVICKKCGCSISLDIYITVGNNVLNFV